MDKIRLLVVDDHPVVRAGLRTLLGAQPGMEVVGEAEDGETAIRRAAELEPDVVVMDITMGDVSGIQATRQIRQRLPETKVLVLTMHDNEEYLRQMLEAGATGYVLKQAVDSELAVAIRAVQRGEVYLYSSFTKVLLGDLAGDDEESDEEGRNSYERLSQREQEVLRQVALGYTNQQIADQLYLSVKTVETYRGRVMAKLNLESRAALVRYALRHRLMDGEGPDAEGEA
ncbi:MAG: response regulator [Anaerolineae bacterium]